VDLTASLHAVAADPPPTRIDLDALIRAEERRGHRQRRLFGAGVVSGVAVVVGAASLGWPSGGRAPLGDGGGPVCPWVSPRGAAGAVPSPPGPFGGPLPSTSGFTVATPPSTSGSTVAPPPSTSGSTVVTPPSSGGSTVVTPPSSESGSPFVPPSGLPSTSGSPFDPGFTGLTGSPAVPANAGASVNPPPVASASPATSPAEVCGDTLRRLDHVLSDALARIAPNACPTTPIRFSSYPGGAVHTVVTFDGGRLLFVELFPLWESSYEKSRVYFLPTKGTSYEIGSPARGVVAADPNAGPLTDAQLRALANDSGLTL